MQSRCAHGAVIGRPHCGVAPLKATGNELQEPPGYWGATPAIDRPTEVHRVRRPSQDLIGTASTGPSVPRVRRIPDLAAELTSGRRPPNAARWAANDAPVDPGALVARAIAILGERPAAKPATRGALPSAPPRPPTKGTELPLRRPVLSDGAVCPLPIRYFDLQYLVLTFLTDIDRAADLLRGTGLRAVPQEDGKAIVQFGCFEYRQTDIGPYNEMGLVILATASGDPAPASYVVNLPVNTAFANRAGREIWGYNKFVADIEFKNDGRNFSATLHDHEKALICSLEGKRGPSVPLPPTDILTFSVLEGTLIKTLIRLLTPLQLGNGDSFLLKVGPSDHQMARNLRALALDGARPVLLQYADPAQSLLFAGRLLNS
jgi:hypothetical protein